MWFESLTGFRETSPEDVRAQLVVDGQTLTSTANGRRMLCGRLETPSLAELRARVEASGPSGGKLTLGEVVADVQKLHGCPDNAGALFQVASQFNLLEMVSPSVTPERGVDVYETDHTQGPACAIACGAGTIYRNYFADVDGHVGQSAEHQIDCLRVLGAALGNDGERLWRYRNGYALATAEGLEVISRRLSSVDDSERDALREVLRIGIQWSTEVTIGDAGHTVTQAYCSALPVAYSEHSAERWEDFARLVLEASYEAALWAAVLSSQSTGNPKVFLTLLGGGAFGNPIEWILGALERALRIVSGHDLDVAVVSYRTSNPQVRELVQRW